jgi:RNA recognition motif-containing protein
VKSIYVGNLSFGTTEEELRSLFGEHGTVTRVAIIKDKYTGESRGFGFIDMDDDSQAAAAIEALNGADFGGRTLRVNEARPQQPRDGGRSGGGFRGGRGGRD